MHQKTMRAACKALDGGGEAEGTFEAIVATYALDSVGDKIAPGAFTKSLEEWQASGDPIPVLWSHQANDAFAHIGEVVEATERPDEGLYVKGVLDLDNPTAAQVYRLFKGKRIRNFSFAYDVLGSDGPDSEGETTLTELKVYEVGPTLIGANQETRLLAVKADPATKTGRVLSAKNETDLRHALELIQGVLAQLAEGVSGATPQDAKASGSGTANAEEPERANAEEPSRRPSVDALAAVIGLRHRRT